MVRRCCVVGCDSQSTDKNGVRFFRFPMKGDQREKWISAVRREDWNPGAHSRICSEHFTTGRQLTEVHQT